MTANATHPPINDDTPDMLSAALDYADQGFFLVPIHTTVGTVCSCNLGRKCPRPGKHPVGYLVREGSRQASSYPMAIERWWNRCPWANIGIVCGPSQVVVLDVDPRNDGLASFEKLIAVHGPLPETLTAITGSKGGTGRHYIFSDDDASIRGCKGDAGEGTYPGLEILAGGNLFIAAPSLHKSGRRYQMIDRDALPVRAPAWMRDGLS